MKPRINLVTLGVADLAAALVADPSARKDLHDGKGPALALAAAALPAAVNAAIAEAVRLLDGLPLAIELAAAQVTKAGDIIRQAHEFLNERKVRSQVLAVSAVSVPVWDVVVVFMAQIPQSFG